VPRPSILRQIQALDPIRDHQRVVFLSTRYDFPFDTVRALELALFRTFCVPSIGELLDRTGEFQRRAQKRYDDTDIIVSELMEYGYDSPRGMAALRRMNQLHGRFSIGNDDFLYVLSTFVFEPIRWNERFGWRRMCPAERLALFYFWREVGRRMNVREIPHDYETFERFSREYEAKHFRYTEANHRVGCATRDMFLGWFPRLLRPLVRPAIYAMMDDAMIAGFGFPRPSWLMRRLVPGALRLRAAAVRFLPKRRRPFLRTEIKHRTYPDGYTIERLGPSEAVE
jgi:ER-bound oxygenase mpaB/B'/Rubber oxygenase, catalytic domain